MPGPGRNRTKHRRWPRGWEQGPPRKDGSFDIYFRPTNKGDKALVRAITGGPLSLRLGSNEDEASETYAARIVIPRRKESTVETGTCSEIFERARLTFLPSIKNPKTRKERARHIDALEAAFGAKRYARNVYEASRDTSGTFLRAMDVQRRVSDGEQTRRVAANREARTGELVFIWARTKWGLTEYNPFAGLIENDESPRQVVPGDKDIFKLYRHLEPPARFMIVLIRYYGRRKVEQLALELSDAKGDGIHLRRGKDADARPIILLWDTRLRKAFARLMRWRAEVIRPTKQNKVGRVRRAPRVISTAMILNGRGGRYTESGFNSARKRAMINAGLSTFIGESEVNGKKVKQYSHPFTFHDLRKSRAETLSRDRAQTVLAHDDPRTTNRVYRPGPIVVDLSDEVANPKKKAK